MTPDSTNTPANGPAPAQQWQGLDELAGDAAFWEAAKDEFPEGAAEFTDEVSRRRFIALAGAGVALATGAGCNLRPAPSRKILPYTTQPDEVTPGVPIFFATAAPLSGYGTGVLVRSSEGRPTKVEPNPDHPSSRGGVDALSQASLLDLYDPDRSKVVTNRGLPASLDDVVAAVRGTLYNADASPKKNIRLRVLTETVTSPTFADQMAKLLAAFPEARWAQHDPAAGNTAAGTAKAFGRPGNVVYDFSKADVVLSLDADFLGSGPGSSRYSRDFGDRRKIRKDGKDAAAVAAGSMRDREGVKVEALNRLYAVESMPTCTGSVADHRLALPASLVESFARALAGELGVAGSPAAGTLPDAAKAWLKPLADDLKAKKGKAVVVPGAHQPASLHAIAHAINNAIGAFGNTVTFVGPVEARPEGKVIDLKTLTAEMTEKKVDVLLVLGVNAAYTAPADVPFGDAVKNVPLSLHLGTHQDETAVKCLWHVNEAHYLETWGDIRGHDGTVTIQQPLIAPLYSGKSAIELLAAITAAPASGAPLEGYDVVRAYWKNGDAVRATFPAFPKPDTFEIFWQGAVRAGVVAGTGPTAAKAEIAGNWAADATPATAPADYEINFRPDPALYDGRFANNGWLQELPKPVTKMTWDNAAYMSQATADKLQLDKAFFRWTGGEHGRAEVPVVELKYKGRTIKAPVWVLPGYPDNSVTVHLGYGRERAGRVNSTPGENNAEGKPFRGFNAYTLRTSDAPWTDGGLTIAKTNETYYLACVQGHSSMKQKDTYLSYEWDRKPVRHGDVALYNKYPAFAKIPPMAAGETALIVENTPGPKHDHPHHDDEKHDKKENGKNGKDEHHDDGHHDKRLHPLTMYHPNEVLSPNLPEGQKRRWAMAIDLNACTGCSACVIACVGENNIPVVGKNEVTRGRAMHWINIDRYYEGDPEKSESIKTLFQPRMCVQCEKAPCEIVCPVGATVHSTDGLNDMAYNRCVGTRYCSNNCPYKVRRFNFLSFQDWHTSTLKLGRNPDVSVRSRGVMEKCTFCVQRIRGAEIVAEREHRGIRDGEIVTACQSACPSGAIVFGDLNDSHSNVSRWKEEPRNYGLLAELNTMPRLTHLAVVRNPNPAMPKGA